MNRQEALQTHSIAPSVKYAEKRRAFRHRMRIEDKKSSSILSLAREIAQIKARGEESLYLLPGTGFHVTAEIENFLRNLEKGLSFADCFAQVEQNVQAFKIEYLVQGPVFPIVLEKKEHEGKQRLAGKLYGGGLWLDAVSADERDGVVKDAVRKLEEDIVRGERGDLFVMQSPKGWSGYQLRGDILEEEKKDDILSGAAKKVTYPDAQTYCIQIRPDDSISGFALKSSMNLSQTEDLMVRLGVSRDVFAQEVDEETRIKRVLQHAVKIDSKKGKGIEDVVIKIPQITKTDVLYRDTRGAAHTISEMMLLLKNPDHLWTLDETVKKLMDEWRNYAGDRLQSFDDSIELDLKVSLGYTIMQLMNKMRPPVLKREMQADRDYRIADRFRPAFDPRRTLEEMQKLPGCAGGGTNSQSVDSAGIPRLITTDGLLSAEEAKKDPKLCRCTVGGGESSPHFHCDGSKKGAKGSEKCNHAITVGKGIAKCPSCGKGKVC